MNKKKTMIEQTDKQKNYIRKINYESILGGQITRAMVARDTNPSQYATSIETYLLFCPKSTRDKGFEYMKEVGLERRIEKDSLNRDALIKIDDLTIYINTSLEKDENIIFASSTFAIGSD